MRKLALLMASAALLSPAAFADDTIIVDEGDNSMITGTVVDVHFDSLTVDVSGKEDVEVEADISD